MKAKKRKIHRTSKKDQKALNDILKMVRAKIKAEAEAEAEEKALQEIPSKSK